MGAPKKEKKDTKPDNKAKMKTDKQKSKAEEPKVTTAVLKLHCRRCLDRICETVLKTEGVHKMAIDKEKKTVTVTGTMDVEALEGKLMEKLMEKLKTKVEVVRPKKDQDPDKKGGGRENEGKKKNTGRGGSGGGGGGGDNKEEGGGRMKQSRMNYGPVYPQQCHLHLHFHFDAPPLCHARCQRIHSTG